MNLHADRKIVKTCFETDLALISRKVRDLIGDLVPSAVVFFSRSFCGWPNTMTLGMRGIQINHFEMVVQGLQHCLAGDTRRQRGNGREYRFPHLDTCSIYRNYSVAFSMVMVWLREKGVVRRGITLSDVSAVIVALWEWFFSCCGGRPRGLSNSSITTTCLPELLAAQMSN
jgi:hypothetical protein